MNTMVSLKISVLQKILDCAVSPIYSDEQLIRFAKISDSSPARLKQLSERIGIEYDPSIYDEMASGRFLYRVEKEKQAQQLTKDMHLVSLLGIDSLIVDVELVRYLRERKLDNIVHSPSQSIVLSNQEIENIKKA